MTQDTRSARTQQARIEQSVTTLTGVGPALAEKLARLDIKRVQDLLFHLPLRYEDRTRIVPIGALSVGQSALIEGVVEHTEVTYRGRRTMLSRLSDGTGAVTLRFFHFSNRQRQGLARGTRVRCFGDPRRGPAGIELVHPEYRTLRDAETIPIETHLTPIYPTTDGIGQGRLRQLVTAALTMIDAEPVAELLPATLLADQGLPGLQDALRFIHRPPAGKLAALSGDQRHPAQQRLAMEELLAHHLSLRQLRAQLREHAAPVIPPGSALTSRLLKQLPFKLTAAQNRVLAEVTVDLGDGRPMLRLLQGDVGSGKTVVAAAAALNVVAADYQVVVMAPTELLAEQHRRNFSDWCEPLGTKVVWLGGRQRAAERRAALAAIASGDAQIAVGTHALFQDDVEFAKLGMLIVDEQHRFGVQQRLSLKQKGEQTDSSPHQLVMTATPIPRTLAMTAYADLDCSVIDELPPGRKPVTTVVIPEERRAEVVARIRAAVGAGRQAYWVCPLIEESDTLEARAAEDTATLLADALAEVSVGLVHGRLKPKEKANAMSAFKAGETQLLVATTVIEVGVDVPNASLMIVENAERMGLAQLHQLRGRVGRGATESSCVLMYRPPLTRLARSRLGILRRTQDGFEIAREDLRLRGAGELLGTRQTGLAAMRVADVIRDSDLLPWVRQAAAVLQAEPQAQALISRWVGAAGRYGMV